LESIDFAWSVPHARWLVRYGELKEYVALNGYGNLPLKKYNPALRYWLDRQLIQYRLLKVGNKSSMTEEAAQLLEKLGFT
jgi:hypothetical protein